MATKRLPRPRNPIQLGKLMVDPERFNSVFRRAPAIVSNSISLGGKRKRLASRGHSVGC